jgi:hypothetical protein
MDSHEVWAALPEHVREVAQRIAREYGPNVSLSESAFECCGGLCWGYRGYDGARFYIAILWTEDRGLRCFVGVDGYLPHIAYGSCSLTDGKLLEHHADSGEWQDRHYAAWRRAWGAVGLSVPFPGAAQEVRYDCL